MNTENQKPWLYRSVKSTLCLAFFLEILLSYFMPFSDKGNQLGIGFPYTYLYIQKQGSLNFSPFFSTALNPLRLILNLFFLYLLLKFLSWSWCFLELNRKQNQEISTVVLLKNKKQSQEFRRWFFSKRGNRTGSFRRWFFSKRRKMRINSAKAMT